MSYDNVKLWFAKDADSNEIVTIDQINEDNIHNRFSCPMCGSNLKPKATKSSKVSSHFAHVDASKCNSESMIHWWFKNKFIEVGDSFKIVSDKEREYICSDIMVEQEYVVGDKVYNPDVTVKTECGQTIYFEMNYSNRKSVKEYIDIWIELKNIVVEIDIKKLMQQDIIPSFKALFYDGKCFNVKKGDLYYKIMGKYKENELSRNINDEIKERVRKLDWLWEDIQKYKKGEVDDDYIVDLIDTIDKKDNEIVKKVMKIQNCVNIYENYIDKKSKSIYEEIMNCFDCLDIKDRDDYDVILHDIEKNKRKKDYLKIKISLFFGYRRREYDFSDCNIDVRAKDDIIKIILDKEEDNLRSEKIKRAEDNECLNAIVDKLENKYKSIDNFYNFYGYGTDVFGNLYLSISYNRSEIARVYLPDEIVNSNEEEYIENFIDSKINECIKNINNIENIDEIRKILGDLKYKFNGLPVGEILINRGRGFWTRTKKEDVVCLFDFISVNQELIKIKINDNTDRFRGNYIKPTIFLYYCKEKIYKCNSLDEFNEKIETDDYIKAELSELESVVENFIIDTICEYLSNCKCVDCKNNIFINKKEALFFVNKKLNLPKRCKACRNKKIRR